MLWGSSDTPGGISIGKNYKCCTHPTLLVIGVTVTLMVFGNHLILFW